VTKKLGPLPVWAWGLIFGVLGYYLYTRYEANASTASSGTGTTGILDPNAVDPNTGLTYGEEESAALNNAASAAGNGGGTSDSGLTPNLQTGTTELQDLESFLGQFGTIAQQLGYTPPGGGTTTTPTSTPSTPSTNSSPTTTAAANSPAVSTASPPTSSASVHVNPQIGAVGSALSGGGPGPLESALLTATGLSGGSAQAFLGGILSGSSPFHKVAGTTQKGGLAQTGTYVKAGSNVKYFAFSQGGVLHVRQAT